MIHDGININCTFVVTVSLKQCSCIQVEVQHHTITTKHTPRWLQGLVPEANIRNEIQSVAFASFSKQIQHCKNLEMFPSLVPITKTVATITMIAVCHVRRSYLQLMHNTVHLV